MVEALEILGLFIVGALFAAELDVLLDWILR